jgi:actin-related protein 5
MYTPMQDAEPDNIVPPAQLYHPREAHFEKFIEPRPDGYQKAKSRGGDRAAIVIDNGISTPSLRRHQ